MSKNTRKRSQANRDYYNELFDTQAGPVARESRLSKKRGDTGGEPRRQPCPARHLPYRESVSHLSSSPGWLAICCTITHTLGRFAVKYVQEDRGVDWQTQLASVPGSGHAYLRHRHTCLVAEDRSRLQVEPVAASALLRAL